MCTVNGWAGSGRGEQGKTRWNAGADTSLRAGRSRAGRVQQYEAGQCQDGKEMEQKQRERWMMGVKEGTRDACDQFVTDRAEELSSKCT